MRLFGGRFGGPVWRASRGAVKRRKVQTIVIGFVVFLSAVTAVAALGLLMAASEPFDHAFSSQNGPHAVVVFDSSKADDAQLAATASAAGVTASAGPFPEAPVEFVNPNSAGPSAWHAVIAGRADPGGAVDRLNLWRGRWPSGPGEVVMNEVPGQLPNGPDGPMARLAARVGGVDVPLTVVGFAYSVTGSADAWVSPAGMAALHPTQSEMLYRFAHASTAADVKGSLGAATAGLPSGALLGSQSWLTTKTSSMQKVALMIPILSAFGVLGIAVATLIVLNVVSGAVVSGFRDIGVYKAIGFTPRQVTGVFLATMAVPAGLGTLAGLPLGNLLATPLLDKAFRRFGTGAGVSPWADVLAGIGLPLVVVLAALVPAVRAARMPATVAITAGSAPRRGRGLGVQRRLAGWRLPRPVSLGLGLPFARPGRSALTMASVLLGVTTVTFANGLARSMSAFSAASDRNGAVQIELHLTPGDPGSPQPIHDAVQTLALLRSIPGVTALAPSTQIPIGVVGEAHQTAAVFYDGDSAKMGYVLGHGHWLDGPGQVVTSTRYLNLNGLRIGDRLTLALNGKQIPTTIVGDTVTGSDDEIYAGWDTLTALDPARTPVNFEMHLAAGTDVHAVAARLRAADPAFGIDVKSLSDPNAVFEVFASAFTALLSIVAALGVFNTVLLTTRERRRDLGMLKSIGMTPRQVVAMVVTSMAFLGLIGGLLGLPLGLALHRTILPIMIGGSQVGGLTFMMHVYSAPLLALMFLAGVAIAVLGALVPARSAARLTIAEVLHNE